MSATIKRITVPWSVLRTRQRFYYIRQLRQAFLIYGSARYIQLRINNAYVCANLMLCE